MLSLKKQSFCSASRGITGERFADTVARLGFENVQEQLLKDDLLTRKDDNLKDAETYERRGQPARYRYKIFDKMNGHTGRTERE